MGVRYVISFIFLFYLLSSLKVYAGGYGAVELKKRFSLVGILGKRSGNQSNFQGIVVLKDSKNGRTLFFNGGVEKYLPNGKRLKIIGIKDNKVIMEVEKQKISMKFSGRNIKNDSAHSISEATIQWDDQYSSLESLYSNDDDLGRRGNSYDARPKRILRDYTEYRNREKEIRGEFFNNGYGDDHEYQDNEDDESYQERSRKVRKKLVPYPFRNYRDNSSDSYEGDEADFRY